MTNTYRYGRRLLAMAAIVALGGCLNVPSEPDIPTDPATETFASSLGFTNVSTFNKTTNGVYYTDQQVGTGPGIDSMTTVIMAFQVYLKTGGQVDFKLQGPIDMHSIKVAGLIEGMLGFGATGGMRPGGVRTIVVPSELGYSNQPQSGIPANSTLVFFVQLQSIGS